MVKAKLLLCFTILLFISISFIELTCTESFEAIENIPEYHLPYSLHSHPELIKQCKENEDCVIDKKYLNDAISNCWGYENTCRIENKFGKDLPKTCQSKEHENYFEKQADFGYVKGKTKQLKICKPRSHQTGSLFCSMNLQLCHGRNIFIDLRNFKKYDADRDTSMHPFKPGQIGANCEVDRKLIEENSAHPFVLMSWNQELRNFTSLDFDLFSDPEKHCDIILEGPHVVMKQDFTGNMFHHFCDFFNLFVSQHVNGTNFSKDIQIVDWNLRGQHFFDIFMEAWDAFTNKPVQSTKDWLGKRVCIRDVLFSLLPRMRGGLFYNTYIPVKCSHSSMFRAFGEHFLHRMGVQQYRKRTSPIRVTILQRASKETKNYFRIIKNLDELLTVFEKYDDVEVKVVYFNHTTMNFRTQLNISHNSDIFIGMHGAGLTHFMFLPDWAVAIELYNCGDVNCYKDLARLRGVSYMTWDGDSGLTPSEIGEHYRYNTTKFWNWTFNKNKFEILMDDAIAASRVNLEAFYLNTKYDKRDEL